MCNVKGWKQPMLILALPRGTKAKDMVVLKYSTSTKPQVFYLICIYYDIYCRNSAFTGNLKRFS